jgi:polyhydroxyalkanoate synthesis regulator phasin/type IV secretory pathway VirB10-like protein
MALDFSKFNIFKKLNARSRMLVLFLSAIGIIFAIYLLVKLLAGTDADSSASRVAGTPSGLQSVQGGQLTPEYYRSLEQENRQRAAQAQLTGTSAIPTVVNIGQGDGNQCIICSDQSANVKNNLDDWVKQGSITDETANYLEELANKNVPVNEYEQELAQLVKAGKLTPEQARILLDQYKKQHSNALLQESAKAMDEMIKSGELPIDAANELLQAQKNNASIEDYAAMLNRMVKEGKISPATAQKLLAQYKQQLQKEATKQGIADLNKMAKDGLITADIARQLTDLQNRDVSYEAYADAIQKLVAEGKLTPLAAAKLLAAYKKQKQATVADGAAQRLLKQAEADAENEIRDLLATKTIAPDVAAQLRGMMQQNISLDQFKEAIAQLVAQKKLPPEISELKIADYTKVKGLRDLTARLASLQSSNAPLGVYGGTLKQAVAMGLLSPAEAAQILEEYRAVQGGATVDEEFQQRLQGQIRGGASGEAGGGGFQVQETAGDRQQRLQAIMDAMSNQAQQLVSLWQAPTMSGRVGSAAADKDKQAELSNQTKTKGAAVSQNGVDKDSGEVLIKSGTILFAVLDTTVNSDYPDSPVMATIVDGKYKGGKLLGKLVVTKGVSGQQDRVMLNFTMMNMENWEKSKTVTAYAIDPDSARTVMASQVDYHYLKRYGAIMATAFVQGYANAITTSGSTTTTGIFGTSTTHPELSPGQKLATALGQIGQSLSSTTQNYINIPPTVIVDSGVSLGILFMSDLTV